ncbi:hypothetical protein TMatcc_004739 [Talaromyces marneffei ATCC 18224]|uniref:Uncharacterized protein n=2 Tax=Talaromyces marneffei TaxID=37727 RepID=B6Q2Z7_TALMQ|nr:uncharacterized protein EYB26_000338 [Talaromyces marneffei]EEA26981.1 conserved hypothetical protein [Talaromyces marneffei ATCC 18224]EEA26982.1 conserved hypothetical protein [Talaromyces marneffei ATCC 18224]KAE8557288.1 hypothetical protein EYB25_001995 [Talaromyces marneffei]QGA12694.1 hypothetical protein EYB26_000338 [Talaromyces marneffei]
MILIPLPMQPLRPTFKALGHQHIVFKYHASPLLTNWAMFRSRYTEQPHVLKPKIHEFYDNRDPNTLWWKVTTQPLKVKRVIRSHWSRRLRRIFREALYLRGYDETGKPLPQEKLPEGVTLRTAPLHGTLEMEPVETIITQNDAAVKRLMGKQLDRVIQTMREWPIDEKTGAYIASPP